MTSHVRCHEWFTCPTGVFIYIYVCFLKRAVVTVVVDFISKSSSAMNPLAADDDSKLSKSY